MSYPEHLEGGAAESIRDSLEYRASSDGYDLYATIDDKYNAGDDLHFVAYWRDRDVIGTVTRHFTLENGTWTPEDFISVLTRAVLDEGYPLYDEDWIATYLPMSIELG